MDEGVLVVMVVFGAIVMLAFFRLTYRVIALFAEKRQARVVLSPEQAAHDLELEDRANQLQRRMQNLEEILNAKGVSHG